MIDLRTVSGLGDTNAKLRVYIGNQPAVTLPRDNNDIVPLAPGDIQLIGNACGNGWRKVFNVYAKLLFAMPDSFGFKRQERWQQFRDNQLLQANSNTLLAFTTPLDFSPTGLNIITGRTFAQSTAISPLLNWVTPEFAICKPLNTIVCPYFDYRQLSNAKILFLIDLLCGELNVQTISK